MDNIYADIVIHLSRFLEPEDILVLRRTAKRFRAALPNPRDADVCTYAARYGYLRLLQWARLQNMRMTLKTYVVACRGGHLDVVHWLGSYCALDFDLYLQTLFNAACGGGHLAVIEYLLRRGAKVQFASLREASCGGHLDVLKMFSSRKMIAMHQKKQCALDAALHGHIPILEWLWTICEGEAARLAVSAGEGDQVECLKWIETRSSYRGSWPFVVQRVCRAAASRGSLSVLKYILETKKETFTLDFLNELYRVAQRRPWRNVIQWLKAMFVEADEVYRWV